MTRQIRLMFVLLAGIRLEKVIGSPPGSAIVTKSPVARTTASVTSQLDRRSMNCMVFSTRDTSAPLDSMISPARTTAFRRSFSSILFSSLCLFHSRLLPYRLKSFRHPSPGIRLAAWYTSTAHIQARKS